MRLPPDEVPEDLSVEEYQRLGKLYGLMGRTQQMMDAMNRMRDLTAAQAQAEAAAAGTGEGAPTQEEARGIVIGKQLAEQFFKALSSGAASKTSDGASPEGSPEDFFGNIEEKLSGLNLSEEELAQVTQISSALQNIFKNIQEPETPPRDVPEDLSAQQYYDLGVQYKSVGWTEQARDSLQLAIDMDHDGPAGRAAAVFLSTKIPRHPVPLVAEQLNVEGFNRMHSGDLDAAKELFQSLIHEYPDFEWPYGNLGSLLVQQGDLPGARDILRKAVEINPNYVNGWLHLARASTLSGEFDLAREYLVRASNADPNDAAIESLRLLVDEVESWET